MADEAADSFAGPSSSCSLLDRRQLLLDLPHRGLQQQQQLLLQQQPPPPLPPPPLPPPPPYNQSQDDFVRLLASEQSVSPPANAIHQFSVVRAHGADGLTIRRVDSERGIDDEVHIRDVSTVVNKHRSSGKKIATSLADSHYSYRRELSRRAERQAQAAAAASSEGGDEEGGGAAP